jgi:uncharacterized protein (DUF1330 family)
MQTKYTVALSLVVGFALGAAAIQTLHAQAKSPGYVIAEVNVKDPDGYKKEFLPVIVPIIQAEGGDYLAAGGQTVSFMGAPPPNRVVIVQYESLGKAQQWWGKAKDTLSIGQKYADFTIYAVEGASP